MEHNNANIPEEISSLLRKLLSGIPLHEEELAKLNHWYDEFYDEKWETVEDNLGPGMLDRIHDKIGKFNTKLKKNNHSSSLSEQKATKWDTPNWVRAAMVTFLLAATTLAVYFSEYGAQEDLQKAEEWITYCNPAGQKSKVQLPDGSVIYINAATEVKYQEGFGQIHREVFVEGESFFEVAKDSIPFRVHSAGLVTEALGTSFNISTFDASSIRVQLVTGIVKVYHAFEVKPSAQLSPGEEVRLKKGQLSPVFSFDIHQAIAWKEGTIWLDRTPLTEAISMLERWYDVNIIVTNPPKNDVYFTGEFKNAMLTHLLESLAYSYRFEYKIDKKNITITFNY
ncbi:DUF4974 domain-containing protein [Echinicola soli]|uniref:DUF4974 domain-containing protein n=1 Tax=Echinicola soli TaxID=2591634 RepID=A0A514CIY6_9BACT|nr:FecR family protein [Echinicola soli]QDH79791.1 DUF4974 domain-containing protein [Echinicola soli]